MSEEFKRKKNFDGCIVRCKNDICNINGMKVVKTKRWLKCKNPESTLYEVKLENGHLYELFESEMVRE